MESPSLSSKDKVCDRGQKKGSGGAANAVANTTDLHNFVANLGEEMTDEEFNYKIASILREVDEEAHGAFYMRQTRSVNVEPATPHSASRLNSPHASRRSSRVSLKLPTHQPPPKPAPLNVEEFQEEVMILRRLTEDYGHLVSIFDSDDADMDSYIISALLSSAGLGTPSGMLNTEQLEIAVRLNRADIAKEKIFTEGRSWKKHELDTFMFNAILADQEAFVSLFMENGFDLEAFLTVHMLEKLYTAGLSKRESKTELIQQLWESCRIYKMDWVMLRDIGRVVRQLLGEFYRPYYLSKRFREVIKRAIARHEAEAKEVLITGNPWSKRSSGFASFSTEQTLTAPLDPDAPPAEASSLSAPGEAPVEPPPKTLIKHEGILKPPTEMQRSSNSFVLQAGKRRGVVMPIPVEVGNGGTAVSQNGINGGPAVPAAVSANRRQPPLGNGRVGRGAVRLITNGSTGTEGRSIWSLAPVALEEPELESPPPRRRRRRRQRHLQSDSSVSGEINPTFQRSPSEQSDETSSQPSAPASDPSRKASSVESKQTVVTVCSGSEKQIRTRLELPRESTLSTLHGLRKASFAGKHRGHHRLETMKLTSEERGRVLSAAVRRHEAERAEEKERKRRHRLAQGKRSLYERLTGINIGFKMEQCVPETLASFGAMSKVTMERPAKELMLMCILLGKVKLAQLFWAYEKEPIGGAMFCTVLLGKMSESTTDLAQKSEFERHARVFEEKAEEVLEECYAEDSARAKMLLYRQLEDYGSNAVIGLAARGSCIHFMSHPCCQDFLSEVWMGKLSPKNSIFRLFCCAFLGLTLPFFIPQLVRYARMDNCGILQDSEQLSPHESDLEDQTLSSFSDFERMAESRGSITPFQACKKWFRRQARDILQFYQAPVTRFLYNTIFYVIFLLIFSNVMLRSLTITCSAQEMVVVLMVLSLLVEELKQAFGSGSSIHEYISDGWNQLDCTAILFFMIGHIMRWAAFVQVRDKDLVEARRQLGMSPSTTCHPSFRNASETCAVASAGQLNDQDLPQWAYTSEAAMKAALLGLEAPSSVILEWDGTVTHDHPVFILTEERFTLARVFYAFSLTAFFVRLMYIFSFSIVLGPKLIMIRRMVTNDLLPFLLLLFVILIGYGIAVFALSYPNGYYSYYERNMFNVSSILQRMSPGKIIYEFMMTTYFQMLGDFGIGILEGEDGGCRDGHQCPQFASRKLSVICLSFFILLTQLLMLNLLVATFTSTYFEIEGSSIYFWSYQRYEMIQEFVDRPLVAPPFILIWYPGELLIFGVKKILWRCIGLEDPDQNSADDPFCRSFANNFTLESKLVKWEYMKAQGILRAQTDSEFGARRMGANGPRLTTVLRGIGRAQSGAGGAHGGARGAAGREEGHSGSQLLEGLSNLLGADSEFIEGRFEALQSCYSKIAGLEDRMEKIGTLMKKLATTVTRISHMQKQILANLEPGQGRRIVGKGKFRPHPKTTEITNQLIADIIKEAVKDLSQHCTDISEKIEEKLRIEGLCIKAVMTYPKSSSTQPDVVTPLPKMPPSRRPEAIPPSGQVFERLIGSHRLWRISPFNFERRPGMRVNIPDDKVDWKVVYPDYRPFSITGDRLAYPYPEVEDGPQVDPTTVQYNAYDNAQGVSRSCLRGRVRVGRAAEGARRGLPLNPRGRSGLAGRGLLPHWGPNHVILLALTRHQVEERQGVAGQSPRLQVLLLERNQAYCIPWFLVDHRENCDLRGCSAKIMRDFLLRRVNHLYPDEEEEEEEEQEGQQSVRQQLIKSITGMHFALLKDDFLNDQLNADHAWMEAVLFNCHCSDDVPFPSELAKILPEDDSQELARWYDFSHPIHLRPSHETPLHLIYQYYEAT